MNTYFILNIKLLIFKCRVNHAMWGIVEEIFASGNTLLFYLAMRSFFVSAGWRTPILFREVNNRCIAVATYLFFKEARGPIFERVSEKDPPADTHTLKSMVNTTPGGTGLFGSLSVIRDSQ